MTKHKYFFGLLLFMTWMSCHESRPSFYTITGETMGTYYTLKVQYGDAARLKAGVDSLLHIFNQSLSTYIPESTISKINNSDSIYCYEKSWDPFFMPVFDKARHIYQITDGHFDPTIAPLVNYYGFGYEKKKPLEKNDTLLIQKLLQWTSFDRIVSIDTSEEICISKPYPEVALDFSAIAKGYGVDILADFIQSKGIRNYMIEIGGEIRTLGVNEKGSPWVIGINRPDDNSSLTDVEVPLKVSNKAVATSGNYRNSYESKGQKFAHIIHPKTGMSQETDILSVTVIADDCMTADALATAFMVMGLKKSLALVDNLKNIDAFFIFDLEGDGQFEYRSSENFSRYFFDNE